MEESSFAAPACCHIQTDADSIAQGVLRHTAKCPGRNLLLMVTLRSGGGACTNSDCKRVTVLLLRSLMAA